MLLRVDGAWLDGFFFRGRHLTTPSLRRGTWPTVGNVFLLWMSLFWTHHVFVSSSSHRVALVRSNPALPTRACMRFTSRRHDIRWLGHESRTDRLLASFQACLFRSHGPRFTVAKELPPSTFHDEANGTRRGLHTPLHVQSTVAEAATGFSCACEGEAEGRLVCTRCGQVGFRSRCSNTGRFAWTCASRRWRTSRTASGSRRALILHVSFPSLDRQAGEVRSSLPSPRTRGGERVLHPRCRRPTECMRLSESESERH